MEKRTSTPKQTPQTVMYCNNCGEKGHLFRMCKDPILSCGIILLDKPSLPADLESAKVLMICRKDSLSYTEFMRGKYDPGDVEYLDRLFKNMTLREQTELVCGEFDVLWKKLWGDDHMNSEYEASKKKFYSVNRAEYMTQCLSKYYDPEWGFPKGRRVRCESDIDCAIREFSEETNIPRESYVVLKNMTLEETFTGLNGVQYKHIYYPALLVNPDIVNIQQRFTSMQRREISAIAWKSLKECEDLIRPHHIQRQEMMDNLKKILVSFESL